MWIPENFCQFEEIDTNRFPGVGKKKQKSPKRALDNFQAPHHSVWQIPWYLPWLFQILEEMQPRFYPIMKRPNVLPFPGGHTPRTAILISCKRVRQKKIGFYLERKWAHPLGRTALPPKVCVQMSPGFLLLERIMFAMSESLQQVIRCPRS